MAEPRRATRTEDRLLGGRIVLRQPAIGYRVAIDPVFLAAAAEPPMAACVLDLGCGTGAALLCLGLRRPDLALTGVEIDPAMAALARDNLAANRMADRARIVVGDALARRPPYQAGGFDAVIANPPYLEAGRADPSPQAEKRLATVESAGSLMTWVRAAHGALKAGGMFVVIHRADRIDRLLAGLADGFGDVTVFPLWPKAGAPAGRVIVRARRGTRGSARLAAGMVLHEADGRFTSDADAILREGAALSWP